MPLPVRPDRMAGALAEPPDGAARAVDFSAEAGEVYAAAAGRACGPLPATAPHELLASRR
jgi:hypothetical protein